ncbi:MAG: tRNA (adenosine(37)-N6)-dimethylallyltransferase MiaA [Proteobacteria bacterium]|nr:tRNA (adenosine(37)-N6)-dimethylallyltransferase MiaA [Pseudomonadota bacterium]
MTSDEAPAAPAGRALAVVAGPTASGKSALALALAESFSGVVINADSMQVYRELAVLTARPGAGDLARAPHRLFGALSAAETCSVGRWLALALVEIEAAWAKGRLPIVAGGTGLYLRALLEGLAEVPPVPGPVRREAEALRARLGPRAFHAELARVDPGAAARLSPSDRQRALRAFAVARATGRPLAAWQGARPWGRGPLGGVPVAAVVLLPPRDELYAAIDRRFLAMMVAGACDEVARLAALGLDPARPALRALGVRPLLAHLAGEIGREEAVRRAQRDSRRYAKRQLTWLRTQMLGRAEAIPGLRLRVVGEQYSESLNSKIFPFIRHFLLTPAA